MIPKLNDYSYRFKGLVPIQFLTGFYVGEVFRRFWDQFMSLPVPDRLALKLTTIVPGKVMYIQMIDPDCNRHIDRVDDKTYLFIEHV